MIKQKATFLLPIMILSASLSFAHLPPKKGNPSPTSGHHQAAYRSDCATGQAQTDLAINNVRARLTTGGDFWWDGEKGQYIVPNVAAGSGKEEVASIFAGGLWIGGVDPGNNLKVACQTYGHFQGNNDFWPGPLTDEGQAGIDTCANWDRFFSVSKESIQELRNNFAIAISLGKTFLEANQIPDDIKGWPALGNPFFESIHGFELPSGNKGFNGLADFFEVGGTSGQFEPHLGDFPIIEIRGCLFNNGVVPDQMIFHIVNDAGGNHSNSGGTPIQMEIQTTAFAYKTQDEINDMTFYKYRTVNRAIEDIDSTYFGIWMDPDLGCYQDDYIGCDTTRNLAYAYNADDLDGNLNCEDCNGVATYCTEIPVVGIDILWGPEDDWGNNIKMSSFTYYISSVYLPPNAITDPSHPIDYYNYLTGSWKDGLSFSYGDTGYNPQSTQSTKYAFPSPPNETDGWSMCNENLGNDDYRTVQGVGHFSIKPGAIKEIYTSVIWVPNMEYPCPDMTRFFDADDKAQNLFYSCFDNVSPVNEVTDAFDQVNIFPNPYFLNSGASSLLNIQNLPLNSDVSIFDISGRLLKSYQGNENMELDLRNDLGNTISSGTYIVQVREEGKGIKAFKLVIM